ncbi:alpha/beta fold hydrolase [Roseovarius aestuariivivens]|uniref:alpha/beta fold hydrolase n=1 Tax=Roseovarius aestuariivivens TaxID=1888910 RepID=UPI001082228C|nr:alpha/beta hydrolase [Roseovarius aestuariivivens]
MDAHFVEGGGGIKIHARETGLSTGMPILFIHGWSQHHMCWAKQFESALADSHRLVAVDLRGHGQSDTPKDAESYSHGDLWAEDINSIIKTLELERPVLVGWSYGGLVISDYLRRYGDEDISGINFVGAAVGIGPKWFGSHIGPGFLENAPPACSDDQVVALQAIQRFLHVCFEQPLDAKDMELAMGWNMLVQPFVRASLIQREDDFTPELERLQKPSLVSFGDRDSIVLPKMAETIIAHVPYGQSSEYKGVGHAPFCEDANRFNDELAAFSRSVLN